MNEALPRSVAPELIFGIIAPIGVDIELVIDVLDHTLQEMSYDCAQIHLTRLMREIPTEIQIEDAPLIKSYRDRIAYADNVCRLLGKDALACLAVSAIRTFRAKQRTPAKELSSMGTGGANAGDPLDTETPLTHQAYIVRQLKRPEEVALLRGVYGKQFVLISAYAPQDIRERRLADLERQSRGGLISEDEATNLAHSLVMQDAKESLDEHGQNVRDAFPLGDVFIDATSRKKCEDMIRRFINLFFGSNEVTPTHDEYGMYMAKSASLRSSDLSRQVGAAIFRTSGEIITLGCNEVPKAGGGTYWTEEPNDSRDIVRGHDPNEMHKVEVLVDIIYRLKNGGHLSEILTNIEDPYEIGKKLLEEKSEYSVKDSRIMDLIEFGRIIHAEMSAICDASRKGVSVEGSTLYSTTFPCHLCAKHIVAAGIKRVIYLAPYPKSYASALHRDSIAVDDDSAISKVRFDAFIGVSPFRYRDLFEKGKRKYSGGLAQKWNRDERRPMIEVYFPSYFEAETHVVGLMNKRLEEILSASTTQVHGC